MENLQETRFCIAFDVDSNIREKCSYLAFMGRMCKNHYQKYNNLYTRYKKYDNFIDELLVIDDNLKVEEVLKLYSRLGKAVESRNAYRSIIHPNFRDAGHNTRINFLKYKMHVCEAVLSEKHKITLPGNNETSSSDEDEKDAEINRLQRVITKGQTKATEHEKIKRALNHLENKGEDKINFEVELDKLGVDVTDHFPGESKFFIQFFVLNFMNILYFGAMMATWDAIISVDTPIMKRALVDIDDSRGTLLYAGQNCSYTHFKYCVEIYNNLCESEKVYIRALADECRPRHNVHYRFFTSTLWYDVDDPTKIVGLSGKEFYTKMCANEDDEKLYHKFWATFITSTLKPMVIALTLTKLIMVDSSLIMGFKNAVPRNFVFNDMALHAQLFIANIERRMEPMQTMREIRSSNLLSCTSDKIKRGELNVKFHFKMDALGARRKRNILIDAMLNVCNIIAYINYDNKNIVYAVYNEMFGQHMATEALKFFFTE